MVWFDTISHLYLSPSPVWEYCLSPCLLALGEGRREGHSYLLSCPPPAPCACPCAPPSGWRGPYPVCPPGPVPVCRPASAAQSPAASHWPLPVVNMSSCHRVAKGGRFASKLSLSPIHCKKSLSIFPSPAGMSLTKLSLTGKKLIIPGQGELWSVTPRLGTGKSINFFTVYANICSGLAD